MTFGIFGCLEFVVNVFDDLAILVFNEAALKW